MKPSPAPRLNCARRAGYFRFFSSLTLVTAALVSASTVHANVSNVGGSTSLTSSAIGNTAQIIHYSTN